MASVCPNPESPCLPWMERGIHKMLSARSYCFHSGRNQWKCRYLQHFARFSNIYVDDAQKRTFHSRWRFTEKTILGGDGCFVYDCALGFTVPELAGLGLGHHPWRIPYPLWLTFLAWVFVRTHWLYWHDALGWFIEGLCVCFSDQSRLSRRWRHCQHQDRH